MQAEDVVVEEYPLTKVKIADLKPDPDNPNKLTRDQEHALARAIKRFGYLVPIIINENMEVADGSHRIQVYQSMGLTEIPAYIVPRVNDDIERRLLRQTMNKLRGEHDIKLDADEIALIFKNDKLDHLAELIAQQRESLENILTKHKGIQFQHEDNFDVDKALEDLAPETQLGDIWQLGQHRIACGDCSDQRIINKLMEDKKADMVFTDPPYGIKYRDLQKKFEEIENDDVSHQDLTDLINSVLSECPNIGYICCNWQSYPLFHQVLQGLKNKKPKACIVWDKGHGVQNLDKYFKEHEFMLYFGPFGGEKTMRGDVWRIERQNAIKHPTNKPLELIRQAIQDSSELDSIIFDPFLGSGSTLIACEQTNRICYGVEISPAYTDLCVKRYEAYTHKKAEKVLTT